MNTNSRNFRTKLSDFFDMAKKKPVSISRGEDRFILLDEKEYLDLKDEIASLQKNLISLLESKDGESKIIKNVQADFTDIFEKASNKIKNKKKSKKASGE